MVDRWWERGPSYGELTWNSWAQEVQESSVFGVHDGSLDKLHHRVTTIHPKKKNTQPPSPALLFAQALFSLWFSFSLFFGLWYFFQCVKTSRAYMETAALCKYLWCNISMWIDFPLSPSITAATLWKGSPRPCAQAAGRAHGSAASPCAQSVCVFFLFWPRLSGPAGLSGQCPLSPFWSPPTKKKLQSRSEALSAWRGRCPAKCCDRKMRCRSNGEKWIRRPLLSSHAN